MRWTLPSAVVMLALACGGPRSASTDAITGAESTETSAGSELPDDCQCDGSLSYGCIGDVNCGDEQLCSPITWTCPNPMGYYPCAGQYDWNEDAITCALEALVAGTPGVLRAEGENDNCGLEGCGTDYRQFQILPGRRVVRDACSSSPLGGGSSTPRVWSLADPAYFETCLGWESPESKWDCLEDGFLNSGPAECG